MNTYWILNKTTREQVECCAKTSQDACRELGWDYDDCFIVQKVPTTLWIDQEMIDNKDYQA